MVYSHWVALKIYLKVLWKGLFTFCVSILSQAWVAPPVVISPASWLKGLVIQPLISMYHVTVDGHVTVRTMDHAPWLLSQENWLIQYIQYLYNTFTYWWCSLIVLPKKKNKKTTLKYHISIDLKRVKMSCAFVYKTVLVRIYGAKLSWPHVCCNCDLGVSEVIGMVDCMDVFIASPCDGLWQ